jgi:MinD-like ATPase involved in chromosome partitioning or flagellar assembly
MGGQRSRVVLFCTADRAVEEAVELLAPAGFLAIRCATVEELRRDLDDGVLAVMLDAELPEGRAREIYEYLCRWEALHKLHVASLLLQPANAERPAWEPTIERREREEWARKPLGATELALRLQALLVRAGRLDPGEVWIGTARTPSDGVASLPQEGKVLAFFSARGGVGKTTLAVHVAVGLRRLCSARVALVDGDLWGGTVPLHLGMSPQRTIYDLTLDGVPTDSEVWPRALATHTSGVQLLAAPLRLEEVEHVPEDAVAAAARALRRYFDYVVVDLGSVPAESALAALDVVDRVYVVATPELAALRNTQRLLNVSRQLGFAARVRLVLNRADHGLTVEQVQAVLPLPVDVEVPGDGPGFVAAANLGLTAFDAGSRVSPRARRALEHLVRQVDAFGRPDAPAAEAAEGEAPPRKRQGWLARPLWTAGRA